MRVGADQTFSPLIGVLREFKQTPSARDARDRNETSRVVRSTFDQLAELSFIGCFVYVSERNERDESLCERLFSFRDLAAAEDRRTTLPIALGN